MHDQICMGTTVHQCTNVKSKKLSLSLDCLQKRTRTPDNRKCSLYAPEVPYWTIRKTGVCRWWYWWYNSVTHDRVTGWPAKKTCPNHLISLDKGEKVQVKKNCTTQSSPMSNAVFIRSEGPKWRSKRKLAWMILIMPKQLELSGDAEILLYFVESERICVLAASSLAKLWLPGEPRECSEEFLEKVLSKRYLHNCSGCGTGQAEVCDGE